MRPTENVYNAGMRTGLDDDDDDVDDGDLKEEIAACLCAQSELHENVLPLYAKTVQEFKKEKGGF